MRSLVYVDADEVAWREATAPRLQKDADALVRPIASTVCDLDRRIVRGKSPFAGPFALGHEAIAEVLEVGDAAAAAGLAPGQRVVVPWHLNCGTCAECRSGRTAQCTTTPRLAAFGVPTGGANGGLFDDVVRVPFAAASLVPLHDAVAPWTAAGCSDSMIDAFYAVAPALRARPQMSVLVLGGTATLGLMIVMFAAALGAAEVLYLDRDPRAIEVAARLGATRTICGALPDRVDGHFDLVIDAAAARDGAACAARSTAPGGRCVIRSIYFGDMALPFWDMYATGVSVETGLASITPHAPAVLDLLASGAADPRPVLSPPLAYDDAPAVLLDPPPQKPVFVRPEEGPAA